ncbi:MAG: 50S ribosomal protein L21 [Acidobacteriota bacterium]|jgi:large subunit ribosomal protein L21
MYAVIVSGGAQHRVSEGDVVKLQKLAGAEPGGKWEFQEVLLISDGTSVQVGQPGVENARVVATVLEQGLHPKVRVFKKKRRKQYRRTHGHRQPYTALRIDEIVAG